MKINNDGNVGIGATDPGYKLDVNGTLRATTSVTTPYISGHGYVAERSYAFCPTNNTSKYFLGWTVEDNLEIDIRDTGWNHGQHIKVYVRRSWGVVPKLIVYGPYSSRYNFYYTQKNERYYLWFNETYQTGPIGTEDATYYIKMRSTSHTINMTEPGATDTFVGEVIGVNNATLIPSSSYIFRADYDGNVGIGETNPLYPLHVTGSAGNMPVMKYFTKDTSGLANGENDAITIYAAGNIYASGLVAASDERIKKNIVDADDSECLETLRLLKPKKYQYKDEIGRGTEPVWGFIAQEVRETLPYATQLRQDVLPNIYELANVSQSNVITFVNFNTSNLESNATTLIKTKGIDGENHDVHLVEVIDEHTIRVEEDLSEWTGSVDETSNVITEITTTTLTPEEYDALEDKSGYVANITGYQNANVVVSIEEYNALEDTTGYEEVVQDYTKTTTTYPGTQLFVYGQEVDDFVFLKKDAIWTVATAALQEVDRQLQAEKAKVSTLETQLASVLARLDALEGA
jgi:hypothetical protein